MIFVFIFKNWAILDYFLIYLIFFIFVLTTPTKYFSVSFLWFALQQTRTKSDAYLYMFRSYLCWVSEKGSRHAVEWKGKNSSSTAVEFSNECSHFPSFSLHRADLLSPESKCENFQWKLSTIFQCHNDSSKGKELSGFDINSLKQQIFVN